MPVVSFHYIGHITLWNQQMALQSQSSIGRPNPLIYQFSMVSQRILQFQLYLKNAIVLLVHYLFQVKYYNHEFFAIYSISLENEIIKFLERNHGIQAIAKTFSSNGMS